jgi:hypothetical protein
MENETSGTNSRKKFLIQNFMKILTSRTARKFWVYGGRIKRRVKVPKTSLDPSGSMLEQVQTGTHHRSPDEA